MNISPTGEPAHAAEPESLVLTPSAVPAESERVDAHERGFIGRLQFYCGIVIAAVGGAGVTFLLLFITGMLPRYDTAKPYATPPATLRVKPSQQLSAGQVYRLASPGVVFINATKGSASSGKVQEFTGSGVVIDAQGDILTNYHVVEKASQLNVTFEDELERPATVVGVDPSNDLALIHVNPANLVLHPLPLGNSNSAEVGDSVFAIGAPFGLQRTLTSGLVSALDRTISAPNGFSISGVLQTDAPINPGNSGGPLLDSAGRVIGINSQIETAGSNTIDGQAGSVGIGFSIPVNTVIRDLPLLRKQGTVRHGYLGILGDSIPALIGLGLPATHGALVEQVQPGSPAAKAGLLGGSRKKTFQGAVVNLGGDIVVAVNGAPVKDMAALSQAVSAHQPGSALDLTVVHADGQSAQVTVTLGTQPLQAATQ